MSTIYESMNKGFENKYGVGEHGYNSPKAKTILEKTTPQDRANSDKLKELSKKISLGRNDLTDEDEKFIDDIGFEVKSGYIVPKGTSEEDAFKYSVKYRGHNYNPSQDVTGLSRKLQRVQAGTYNPKHGESRHSDEEARLSRELAASKRQGKERSQKILQTKLDKERRALKDYGRWDTYQATERDRESKNISKPIKDFKRIQQLLSPETEVNYPLFGGNYRLSNVAGQRADIADRRAEAQRRYEDEMAYLDKQSQDIDAWEADLRAEKDRLLRRGPKNESLLKESIIEDVPTYLSDVKRVINKIGRIINNLSEEEARQIIKILKEMLDRITDLDL